MLNFIAFIKEQRWLIGLVLLVTPWSVTLAVPSGKLMVFVNTREAVVKVSELGLEHKIELNGKITIENIPVGSYTISVYSPWYWDTTVVKDVIIRQDVICKVEVVLKDEKPVGNIPPRIHTFWKAGSFITISNADIKGYSALNSQTNGDVGGNKAAVSIDGNLMLNHIRGLRYYIDGQVSRQEYAPGWLSLSHTNSEFYSGQGELSYEKGPYRFVAGGSVTRDQYGYYKTLFKYDLDHYASRMDKNSRLTASFKHEISQNINYSVAYSRNKINSIVGVRKGYSGGYQGWFSDYEFNQPYPHSWFTDPENPFYTGDTLDGYLDYSRDDPDINPYGVTHFFYSGDYPQYSEWGYANNAYQADLHYKLSRSHSLTAAFKAVYNDETSKLIRYPSSAVLNDSSSTSPAGVSYLFAPHEYNFRPKEYDFRLWDGMSFNAFSARAGLGYKVRKFTTVNSDFLPSLPDQDFFIDSVRSDLSPILGLTVPWRFLTFDVSYEKHFMAPEAIYLRSEPFNLGPMEIANLKNQYMLAQSTDAINVEVTGEPSRYVKAGIGWQYQKLDGVVDVNKFDTPDSPWYLSCTKTNGTLKALEAKINLNPVKYLSCYFDYTLSWAKTTKETEEIYITYGSDPVDYPDVTYDSDFDQSRRFLAGVSLALDKGEGPRIFGLHPLENLDISLKNIIAGGLPYTKTDLAGRPLEKVNSSRLPGISRTDLSLARSFVLWQVNCKLELEVTNLFNAKDTIYVNPATGLADNNGLYEAGWLEVFRSPITRYYEDGSENPLYNIKADLNRDDYISADEHYLAAVKANDDIQKDMNNGRAFYYGRQMRLMLGIKF
ncbi:MAG: hypothetical protein Q7U71_02920 [bacterium]|nr:hypothetical protein [bacterium]